MPLVSSVAGFQSHGRGRNGIRTSAITTLSAAATNGGATITFSAPPSNGFPVRRYEYRYSTTSDFSSDVNGPFMVPSGTSPFTISGLTNGTTYFVRLTAVNDGGYSPESTNITVTPIATQPPGPPTIEAITRGNGFLTVPFTAPTNSGTSPITGYTYRYSTSSTLATVINTVTLGSTIRTFTITGLTNGTLYYIGLVAVNSAGSSSEVIRSETPATVPGIPESASASVTTLNGWGIITVSFTAPTSTGGSPILGYKYAYNINNGAFNSYTTRVGTTPLSITINGLGIGVSYSVRILAYNAIGDGSSRTTNSVIPTGPPSTPYIISASDSSGSGVYRNITITFATTESGGSATIEFIVRKINYYGITTSIYGGANSVITYNTSDSMSMTYGITANTPYGTSGEKMVYYTYNNRGGTFSY